MHGVELFENAPPLRRGDWAQSPTLPLPPPRSRGELDGFLETLSTVAVQDVEAIRAMFAGFSDRQVLAAVFHEALNDRPCGDIGRFMLLLSVVGELADPSSLEPLHDLVWTEDADLLAPESYSGEGRAESSDCMFSAAGMIQARSAEMFAWIAAGREDDRLLRIVAEHTAVVTRLATADAYLFAHADAAEALERVLTVARAEDRNGIGVPRFVRGSDSGAFDRAMEFAHVDREVIPPSRIPIQARGSKQESKGEY